MKTQTEKKIEELTRHIETISYILYEFNVDINKEIEKLQEQADFLKKSIEDIIKEDNKEDNKNATQI